MKILKFSLIKHFPDHILTILIIRGELNANKLYNKPSLGILLAKNQKISMEYKENSNLSVPAEIWCMCMKCKCKKTVSVLVSICESCLRDNH